MIDVFTLSEFGSVASIISLVTGIVLGFFGCKTMTKINSGDNNIVDVDNTKGNIKQIKNEKK